MKRDLDQQLCREFPLLFRLRHRSIYETTMGWGFETGDGWFDIIYNAAKKIEPLIEELQRQGVEEEMLPAAAQVKEKFGTLRFYTNMATAEIEAIVDEAEKLSTVTCDVCGKPGKLTGGGWLSTRCEEHK